MLEKNPHTFLVPCLRKIESDDWIKVNRKLTGSDSYIRLTRFLEIHVMYIS